MPRILHCIDTTGPGGAETVFVGLAEELSRAPYQSFAVIRGPGWVKQELLRRGVPVFEVDAKGSMNFALLAALVRHIRRLNIDLVHAHLLGANVYCGLAGWTTRVPVVSTFHGSVDISPKERLGWLKFLMVRRLTTVVAVSEPLRREVAGRLGTPIERIRLIPNGIDCRRFAMAEPLGLRLARAIPDDALVIGSLGNIRPAKAYPVGLRALRALRDRGVDAHWVVAGQSREGDPQMSALMQLADSLDVSRFVHFIGFVEQPERFLADIDCLLLCSESEGHPLALTQAMAAGKPIVATRCGVEDLIEDGRCGWLAPVNDPDALAAAVVDVAAHPDEARRRGEQARALALAGFDNCSVFANYRRLYDDLLAGDDAGVPAVK